MPVSTLTSFHVLYLALCTSYMTISLGSCTIHTHIHTYISRGAAPLCVAGVALGDVHLDYMQGRFAWQASLMALGDIHLDFTWHAVWHNLTSMTPAVDHDYIPGMITSHGACRKSSQNLRLRPKECRTLLWSAEVWRAHHRFDRGLCHKRSFGKQRREKNIRAWWSSKKASETRRET